MTLHNPVSGFATRTARWSAVHPWRAILGWLALVAVAVGLAIAVPTEQTRDADYRLGESGRADAMVHEAGLDRPDTENVLITAPDGEQVDRADAEGAAAAVREDMRSVDGVTAVAEPQWNADGTALLVAVQLARDHDDVQPLLDVTDHVRSTHPDLLVAQAGELSLDEGVNKQVEDDLASAEGISLPVTLVLMLLAFGALVAAGIPVLLAVSSVVVTIGLTAPLSHLVHAEPTVSSMIVLIGMAVGVDYSLFYLKREREERAAGHSTLDAVQIAAETSGHSILVSGGAVIASMAGLYVMGGATFNSLATGAILVVAVAVLGSITVLPALLARLGRWADRPRVPLLWRLNRRIGRGGLSARILAPVVRRPLASLVAASFVLVALCLPALGMKMHSSTLETLPTSIPEVQTMQRLTDAFPVEGSSAELVVRAPASEREAVGAALADLQANALGTGSFVDAGPEPVRVSADGRTSVLTLAMPYDESDGRVDTAVERLRSDLAPAAFDGDAGDVGVVEWAVGGGAADSLDYANHQRERLPLVIGFVLLLTLVMMVVAFHSVVLAVISTVLNLVSVGVAFGILALVFQHGWFSASLDFTSPGFVIDWIPLFVLVVLVGLSMDYHVFVLSRVREHLGRGLPARLAVRQGVADTAGVVTSAAAVMVSVFAIFASLSMLEMKMMGVGLSAAILIDATLIRLVVLPAVLVLLGERAWWPGRPTPPRGQVVEQDAAYDLARA
ncbi:MMPL family transporter [Nocardioides guangzhouensis]|uniref:MMPL family transporter n=1 Tax=Nocardioides guangzhouensis TaxID=2497878 RepID=A0A4Q4Z349_9ACTN|nr:MMPL family transporter [Nocardioides guangzhouensis]RYP82090.1 MMPL family transporter [Nocardioides guangzhouensis]